MLEPGLTMPILMILIVLIIMSFWRQVLVLLLSVVVAVFCFGLYYLASLLDR
jgi:hypothetical protein